MSSLSRALRSTTWIVAIASLSGLYALPARADLPCRNHYYVSEGETVETIAARCGTSVGDLIRANPSIEDPRALLVGQKLLMPRNAYVLPFGRDGLRRDAYNDGFRRDGFERGAYYGRGPRVGYSNAAYDGRDGGHYRRFPESGTYLVQFGDTLDDIAYDLGVSRYALLAANPQIDDADYLQTGERLRLPDGSERAIGSARYGRGYGRDGFVGRDGTGRAGRDGYGHPGERTSLAVRPYVDRGRTGLLISADSFPPNSTVKIGAGSSLDDSIVFTSGHVGPDGVLKIDVAMPDQLRRGDAVIVATTIDDKYRAYSDRISFPNSDRTGDLRDGTVFAPPGADFRSDGIRGDDIRGSYSDDYGGYAGLGDDVTLEGVVTPEGQRCPAIRDAAGRLFTLATTNEHPHPGDRVRVTGKIAPQEWCGQGISIAVVTVTFGLDIADGRRDDRFNSDDGDRNRDDNNRDRDRDWNHEGKANDDRTSSGSDRDHDHDHDHDRDGNNSGGDRNGHWNGKGNLGYGTQDDGGDRTETIRGTLTDEGVECTIVRGFDGTLYSIPARLTAVRAGEKIELVGHRTHNDECRTGITFEVEDAHRL